MKKLCLSLLAICAVASAQAVEPQDIAADVMVANLQASIASEIHINNVINWKVGEYQDYEMDSSFGNMGNMHKSVASEQGNAIWIVSEMGGGMGGDQKVEALIDRANGKILEMRQNGKKVEVPNDPIEVISQDATSITVPAGTFDVIHVVAKSPKVKKLEVWANPRDITMDGSAQMYVESGFLPITLKLTKFGGR